MERKFKVWDKENKKWIDDTDIAINQEGLLFIRHECQCDFVPMSLTKSANYEVVFSTGLLDKNGVEIYGGDIVELKCTNHKGVTATITWKGHGFHAVIHDKMLLVKGGSSKGKTLSAHEIHCWSGMHDCFSFPRYMEKIGNKFQDKGLLR